MEVLTMIKDWDFGFYGKGIDGYVHYSLAMDRIREEEKRRWNTTCAKYMIANLDPDECRRRTNAELGLPADYSPGRYA